jgi:hypothetical protein
MERAAIGVDAAPVPGHPRVHPAVVDIAVEALPPVPRERKSQLVPPKGVFVQARHDHDVLTLVDQPPMEREHAIAVVHMEDVHVRPGEGRQVAPHAEQLAGEAQEVQHDPVVLQPFPPNLMGASRFIVPGLVFEDLLPHEQVRNAHGRQQEPLGHARSASRVPGTGVGAVGQPGHSVVTPPVDQVMIFYALHRPPGVGQPRRRQFPGYAVHLDEGSRTGRGLSDCTADGLSQPIRLQGVEAGAALAGGGDHGLLRRPVLGDMDGLGLEVPGGVRHVLAKPPAMLAALLFDDTDFIVAEAVGVALVQIEPRVVDQKLSDVPVPIGEDQAAGPPTIGEVEAVVQVPVRLPVVEVEAAVAEVAARMVVDDIEDHRQPIHVTQVHHHPKLVGSPKDVGQVVGLQPGIYLMQERIDAVEIVWQMRVVRRDGVIGLRREIIHSVVAHAEHGGELDDGERLDGIDPQGFQVGQSIDEVEKGPAVPSNGDVPGADVQLINDQLMELRRLPVGIVPGEGGRVVQEAVAVRPHRIVGQVAGERVTLWPLRAVDRSQDMEQVTVAMFETRDEAGPSAVLHPREMSAPARRPGAVRRLAVIPQHVDFASRRRPDSKCRPNA